MAGPTNSKRPVSGGKCKATEGKSVSPPSKKKVIPGAKISHHGKIATKSPVKETNHRKCTPRKVPWAHKHSQYKVKLYLQQKV